MNYWKQETYIKAWDFATLKHSGQTYGGKNEGMRVDYLNHVGSVAMEVMSCLMKTRNNYNADLMITCALLHDTLEDTKTTFAELQEHFEINVAEGVLALTKSEKIADKGEKMNDSLTRIMKAGSEIACVKVADRISNLYHPPYYWNNDKILAYRKEADLILKTLTIAEDLLLERLAFKIKEYNRFLK